MLIFCSNTSESNLFDMQKEIGESSWFGFALIMKKDIKISREIVFKHLDKLKIEYRPVVTGNFLNQPVCKFMNIIDNGVMTMQTILIKTGFTLGIITDISYALNQIGIIEKEILKK